MPEKAPDYQLLFESSPLLILVLTPELKLLAGTDAYFAATLTKREEVIGRLVYDVFPDNPNDPNPTGVANLKASFNRVLANKVPDAMGHLKYDIPCEDGTFESRYWSTMNTPVLDKDGNIMHIINQVVDITDYIVLQQKGDKYEKLTEELKERAENMESEIYQRAQQLQAANEKLSLSNEELRVTQEELQSTNEEMQTAHEELRSQQEELQELNTQLILNNESLERATVALQLKAEELERSNSFKTDFLSNMSHELRTPLNSMLILSKLLSNNAGKNLTPRQVEQATIINKAGNDLLTLINDILDLTKIEAGKIELVMEKTPVIQIVESLENIFSSVAAQKEIEFTVNENVSGYLYTDKFRLEQVLKNLLSNAFKFTEKGGGVTFTVSKAPASAKFTSGSLLQNNAEVLVFAVQDTGIGIPENKLPIIFDAFKQVDGSTSRKYGGTGLGLSISKQLTALLGGEVQVESTPGKGSTFYIYLPVSPPQQQDEEPALAGQLAEEQQSEPPQYFTIKPGSVPTTPGDKMKEVLGNKKILIADDDERNIIALTTILESYGCKLIPAINGKEAVALLKKQPVDLVLMDIMMPEMDGYEAVKLIRSDNGYKQLPIIVMTAKSIKPDFDKGLLNGASDYLQKPLDIGHLLSTMEVWLTPRANVKL